MRFSRNRSSSSLRRLRTVFSSGSGSSASSMRSIDTSPMASPDLSRSNTPSHERTHSSPSSCHSHGSTASTGSARIQEDILALRRRTSLIDVQMEEEARIFSEEIGMLEPRPTAGPVAGGIFEVLDGRV